MLNLQVDKGDFFFLEPTYFAHSTTNKNVPKYWLAGDIEDARRADYCFMGISNQNLGADSYYIRIVIEVDKKIVENYRL
jgi:hypothetical protein